MGEPSVERVVPEEEPLSAGPFSDWLAGMQRALRGEQGSDVPCGRCTACCTSSQFIHIGPDETETLASIPADLLFPAPRLPRGNVLLPFDEHGHCPMLVADECTIYEQRPQTCRAYDCRVFPASGIEIDDDAQRAIALQARRWRFGFPAEIDRVEHDAVRAAAVFIQQHPEDLPGGAPVNPTQHAVLAIRLHTDFLDHRAEPA